MARRVYFVHRLTPEGARSAPYPKHLTRMNNPGLIILAGGVRFELTNGCPLPVFKTGAIDHSATLPIFKTCSGTAGFGSGRASRLTCKQVSLRRNVARDIVKTGALNRSAT